MTSRRCRPQRRLASACGAFLAFALSPLAGGQAHAQETFKPLFQAPLSNVEGKTFTTAQVDFGPGVKAASHRHGQAFVYAYVLRGAVRSQLEGEPAKIYRVGEFWSEPPGAHHVMTENVSNKLPATLLVTFVADTDEHLKVDDVPAPK